MCQVPCVSTSSVHERIYALHDGSSFCDIILILLRQPSRPPASSVLAFSLLIYNIVNSFYLGSANEVMSGSTSKSDTTQLENTTYNILHLQLSFCYLPVSRFHII